MSGEIPMSVKRLIAEVDVSDLNVAAFCRAHGISRTLFYELRKRFEAEGPAGLEPRSRAAKTVANKTPEWVEELIVRLRKELDDTGLDAGPETIRWHLAGEIDDVLVPSVSTIWRILKARGLITADPSKRPSKTWKRFVAGRANELFQIDGTDYELANGQVVKIINVIDDGSRYCPASNAARSESFDAAWSTLTQAFTEIGMCAKVLSDNSKGFTKLTGHLAVLGIAKTTSSPFHPQTCGKVERFHQTQATWLAARPAARDLAELQVLLDEFRHIYNHRRPHRGIDRTTPASKWTAMPKTGPADRPLDLATPTTIHHSKVGINGVISVKNYIVCLGVEHAGKTTDTIITGTQCNVFIGDQHIRGLKLDPTRRVQPRLYTHRRPQGNQT